MIYSFLMIGQSNMAGRGHLGEVPKISDPRLLMLRNCRWQKLSEPLNFDRPRAGVSLATSFAYRFLQDHPEDQVGVIPCADGGTGIDDWAKGSPLYENAVFCTKQAMKTSTLTGILWHQGEHDACEELAGSYVEKLVRFFEDLKADLGVSVPIVLGGLPLAHYSDDADRRHYSAVLNGKLRELVKTLPDVYFVTEEGLGCNEDYLHINSESLREFGDRYYRAFSRKESVFDLNPSNGL